MRDAGVPFDDRGLAYGDGVFETALVRDGRAMLWDYHLARLARGCKRLGFACPNREELAALPGLAGPGQQVLKLIVTRGSGGRGYLAPQPAEPRWRWHSAAFEPAASRWQQGVTLRLCHLALGRQPTLAGIKHLNRLENVLARREWDDPEIAEGVLCDEGGNVIEATCMNLFWAHGARLETPALDACGVAGTLREALLERLPIAAVTVDVDRLLQADVVWAGNSVQGVWPVRRLLDAEGRELRVWTMNAAHRELQNVAHDLLGYPRFA